jgi:hypothetical protein
MTVARAAFHRVLILGAAAGVAIGALAIGALGMNNQPGNGPDRGVEFGKLIVDELILRRRSESLR